jgi:hypothetical protein
MQLRLQRGRLSLAPLVAVLGVLMLAFTGCGGDDPEPAPSPPSPPPPSPSAPAAEEGWQPRLVLTPDEIAEIRAHLAQGDEPWASAWQRFSDRHLASALDDPAPVERGPYRGGGPIHEAFRALDRASRSARDLAIAYALTGDEEYGARARDILLEWSAEAEPTGQRHLRSIDIGQLQSWGAFSFAYAYDLTRGGDLYTAQEQALVADYFTRFSRALGESLHVFATDPVIGTGQRRLYEWSDELTFRFEDWIVGGTFSLAMECAIVALSIETGDEQTLHWLLVDEENTVRADRVIAHALDPDNDGDGRGTTPVPVVSVMLKHRPERGGTVDYMTYAARLATLLTEITESREASLWESSEPLLRRSWLYLSRFFGEGAEPSPNPQDIIDQNAALPRFVPAYAMLREAPLLDVILSGDYARYYEPQFLGPVTLTHAVTR